MGGWHDDVVDMMVGLLTMTIVRNSEIYNHLMALQPVNTGFAPVYGYQKWIFYDRDAFRWLAESPWTTDKPHETMKKVAIYIYLYIYIYI